MLAFLIFLYILNLCRPDIHTYMYINNYNIYMYVFKQIVYCETSYTILKINNILTNANVIFYCTSHDFMYIHTYRFRKIRHHAHDDTALPFLSVYYIMDIYY